MLDPKHAPPQSEPPPTEARRLESRRFEPAEVDPGAAVALFERAAPGLGTPSAVWFEGGGGGPGGAYPSDDGIVRWRIRTPAGALRLKASTVPGGRASLRANVDVLKALAAAKIVGLQPPPEVLRFVEDPGGLFGVVVIETRGADRDAGTEWQALGRPAREAVVDRWALALTGLHEMSLDAAGLAAAAAVEPRDLRESLVDEVACAVEIPRGEGLLPESFLKRVEIRLCRAVDRMPCEMLAAPCHGRPRLSSVLLARREFATLRDFECARPGDPVSDVALAALTLGDPGGGLGRRFIAAYVASAGRPAVLEERIAFHVGLELLRCVTAAASEAAPEVVAAVLDGLEAWLEEGLPIFR